MTKRAMIGDRVAGQVNACHKCLGARTFSCYSHVASGTCFACKGVGIERHVDRSLRSQPQSEWPRAVKLSMIADCLALLASLAQGRESGLLWPETPRAQREIRIWLVAEIRELSIATDVEVFDRAMVAVDKFSPRDWDKVRELRAQSFPSATVAA